MWISVSDKFPMNNEQVIVTMQGERRRYTLCAMFSNDPVVLNAFRKAEGSTANNCWYSHGFYLKHEDVLYWQSLPEPNNE